MLFGVKFATQLQISQRNSVPFVFSSLFRRSQTVPSESRTSRSDRLVAGNRFPFFPRRGFSIVPQPLFLAQGVVLGSSQKEVERADIFFLSSDALVVVLLDHDLSTLATFLFTSFTSLSSATPNTTPWQLSLPSPCPCLPLVEVTLPWSQPSILRSHLVHSTLLLSTTTVVPKPPLPAPSSALRRRRYHPTRCLWALATRGFHTTDLARRDTFVNRLELNL